jgi:hypothetical protein
VSIPTTVLPENATEPRDEFKRADIGIARLESLLRMMEMSEVGVFELDTHGSMLWANVRFVFFDTNQKSMTSKRRYIFASDSTTCRS